MSPEKFEFDWFDVDRRVALRLLARIVNMTNEERYSEARELLTKFSEKIEAFPELSHAKFIEALIDLKQGNRTSAVELAQKNLSIHPDHAPSLDIASSYVVQKGSSNITTANNTTTDIIDKAFALLKSGNPDGALELCDTTNEPLLNRNFIRAISFLEKSMPSDAQQALKEELRLFPENNDAIELKNSIEQKLSDVMSND